VLNITLEIIFGTMRAPRTYHKHWTELAKLYWYHIYIWWAFATKGQVEPGRIL